MPNITQIDIEDKLLLFLNSIGEKEQFEKGICNAFAFMNFRADVFDLEDQNLSRMQKLVDKDDDAIVDMAELYKYYKEQRLLLLESKTGEGILPSLNLSLKKHEEELTRLKQENKDQKAIASLKKEIIKLRAQRDQLIKTALEKIFNPDELEKIREAGDAYIYINTSLAAFAPSDYGYRVEGKLVTQKSYAQTLQLLAPIPQETKRELKVEARFEIAFNFTEQELINLFSDERIIRRGDYIALGSSNHAMYLSCRDGIYRLFDPGPIEIKGNTAKALVAAIKDRFYTRHGKPTDYMSIGINIFEKLSKKTAKIDRPKALTLIKDILTARAKSSNHNINDTSNAWDHTSSAHMAARYGITPEIEVLAEFKADLGAPNDNGNTPVYLAAQENQFQVIEALAKIGRVDLNRPNNVGKAPVFIAARSGHSEAIRTLAENGADLDIRTITSFGHTPTFIAAWLGHERAIKTLFDCGADIDKPELLLNQTPLHTAIKKSNFSAIKTLIYCGADLNAKDKGNRTPIDLAPNDKVKSFTIEQIQLKQSFAQLQRVINLALGSNDKTELNHTTEDQPALHLRVFRCSSTELLTLNTTLKKLGIEAELIQTNQKIMLVVSNLIPSVVLTKTNEFERDFKEIYQSTLQQEQTNTTSALTLQCADTTPQLDTQQSTGIKALSIKPKNPQKENEEKPLFRSDTEELYTQQGEQVLENTEEIQGLIDELKSLETNFKIQSKLNAYNSNKLHRFSFHFIWYNDATKATLKAIRANFLSTLNKYVDLLPEDNLQSKIEVYKLY